MPLLELHLDDDTSVFVYVDQADGKTAADFGDVASTREKKLSASFDKVSASLARVVESIEGQLSQLRTRPDEVTLGMSATLSSEADLMLVSGEASGTISITMTWKKPG